MNDLCKLMKTLGTQSCNRADDVWSESGQKLFKLSETVRKRIYAISAGLTLVGIFAMRWNVVIGGQLFSKSFLGYTTYKIGFVTREGLLISIFLLLLPLAILWVLVKLLPPWPDSELASRSSAGSPALRAGD